MKWIAIPIAICTVYQCPAQSVFNKVKKMAGKDSSQTILKNIEKQVGGNKTAGISNDEVIKGLKEALTIGTQNSSKLLHQTDGFLGNAAIKILIPSLSDIFFIASQKISVIPPAASSAALFIDKMSLSTTLPKPILFKEDSAFFPSSGMSIFMAALPKKPSV